METNILIVLAVLAVVAISSIMGIEDKKKELDNYCEMVGSKTWPDYRGIYQEACASNAESESLGVAP